MGHCAGRDPAALGLEPGGVAGRPRSRAAEFCAPDACERRARRGILENPPDVLSLSRHSGARAARTRNLEVPRCAIAHLRFDAAHRPGTTIVIPPGETADTPPCGLRARPSRHSASWCNRATAAANRRRD